ncbi:MAG: serine/threonine protein kinase [Acidobacteriota bacterium]|nr:serine/threonine protein kinase [Acidobacteriota bacterium]
MRRKARDTAGSILPGYADLREIGGGAFATVFKAVEVETGRPVALKILKVDTIHAQLLETFTHEIQALAAVSDHPNIVTLYRPSNTVDGRPVLVLELCRESLAQQMRTRGPIEAPDVTRIGIKIAGALETAHRNGFLHRDMKPQNILVTQFGEPALADFGVAALQASAQLTAGVFGFTTLHAAPEMLEGQHLSPATDIYGLASTMYQLLTGRAPFASYDNEAPASVILRILRDPVRPLRDENVPLELADLLEGALSKEPDGRPRSALAFAQMLQRIETAQGWPETTFVAWGQEGRQPAPLVTARGPLGVIVSAAAPTTSADPAGSHQGSAAPGRRPRSGPRGNSPDAPEPPGGGVGPGSRHDSVERDGARPSAASLPPLLPSGPPDPPRSPLRPALVEPSPGIRRVITPVEAVQGRDAPLPLRSVGDHGPDPAGSQPGGSQPGGPPPGGPASSGPPPAGSAGTAPAVPSAAHPTATHPGPPPPPPPPLHPPRPAAPTSREADGRPTVDLRSGSAWPPGPEPVGGDPPGDLGPRPEAGAVTPVFVDPDPSEWPEPPPAPEPVSNIHQLSQRRPRPVPSPSVGFGPSQQLRTAVGLPAWALYSLVLAGLVVVAAVLLATGVL